MLRDLLRERIRAAVSRLVAERALPPGEYEFEVTDPKQPEHGDYACNFALLHAKRAGMSPRELAEMLAEELRKPAQAGGAAASCDRTLRPFEPAVLIETVEVAGPGFLNLRLNPVAIAEMLREVLAAGEDLAKGARRVETIGEGESKSDGRDEPLRLNVEFVSVNPNGPITVGSGRGAAFGSTLCNVLEAAGHKVHREYYINDGTNSEQMRLFAESVRSHLEGSPLPAGGYHGEYVEQIARQIAQESSALRESVLADIRTRSEKLMIDMQRSDLDAFSTTFHTWFSEQSLHESGFVKRCIEELIAKGAADEEPYRLEIVRRKGGEDEIRKIEQPLEEDDDEPLHNGSPDRDIEPRARPATPTQPLGDGGDHRTLWLRSTKFADDKDRVLRRRDGRWTYIASDVAYHKSKFERGSPPQGGGPLEPADKLITILGPDHHGYIGRLRAVVAALLEEGITVEGADEPARARRTYPLSDTDALIYRSPAERDACLAALEEANKRLQVVIFQIVRFVKDGKPAPMRKRDGNIYSLRDLMLEIGRNAAPDAPEEEQLRIGKDVARFFYLMRSHDTHMDFDLDLAEKQSEDNPVYYVQYAHARICSVLRKAQEAGFGVERGPWGACWADEGFPRPRELGPSTTRPAGQSSEKGPDSDPERRPPQLANLTHPKELALIKKIADLPHEVRRCAQDYGVHRLTTYAMDLARVYHAFYDSCRVIQVENPELTRARLALCEAAKIALQCTFDLLGISAPERMTRADAV